MDVLLQQRGIMTMTTNSNEAVTDNDNLSHDASLISLASSAVSMRVNLASKSTSSMKFASKGPTRSSSIFITASTNSAMVSLSSMPTYNLPDNAQVGHLQVSFYEGLNIMGWCIRFHHLKCMQWLMKKGYDVTASIENVSYQPSLQYIVLHGLVDMVDVVKGDKRLRWEMVNDGGMTGAMIAAKEHKLAMAKKLFLNKADPRKALQARYASWVLAWARKVERNEVNTETGRTGEDDAKYFPITSDPYYSVWYAQ